MEKILILMLLVWCTSPALLSLPPSMVEAVSAGAAEEKCDSAAYPCYIDYDLHCKELKREDHLPEGMKPLQVGEGNDHLWSDDPDTNFRIVTESYLSLNAKEYHTALDSLCLLFSPFGESVRLSEEDKLKFTVTVLFVSIVNYEVLSSGFFARNFPFLRELHVAIDYFTDEYGKRQQEEGVTIPQDSFKNLKYLEVFRVRIRPPCVKIENFLLPFENPRSYYVDLDKATSEAVGEKPRLKNLWLGTYGNGCDLGAVKMANVSTLISLWMFSLSSQPHKTTTAPPTYVPPGFSVGSGTEERHLFPGGLQTLVVRVPSFLEMMCQLYREIGGSNRYSRGSGRVLNVVLSIEQLTEYVLPAECMGMFDTFIFSNAQQDSNNDNEKPHPLPQSGDRELIIGGSGLVFNDAVWDGLVSRNWKSVVLVGTLSLEKPIYSFPPSLTSITVKLHFGHETNQPYPCTVLISSLCLLHSCSKIRISGDRKFSEAIDVRLTDSVETEIEHVNQHGNYPSSTISELQEVSFVDVNLTAAIAVDVLEHYYPKLSILGLSNSNVDVASVFANDYGSSTTAMATGRVGSRYAYSGLCEGIRDEWAVKPSLTWLEVMELNVGVLQDVGAPFSFAISEASFCKYPNLRNFKLYSGALAVIMPRAFSSVPLKGFEMKPTVSGYGDYMWPTTVNFTGRHVVVSGGLFGHSDSLGARVSMHNMPIRNITEKLCANNREQDWYFSEVEFRNVSLVDFDFRSLCSPICNETDSAFAYCDGVRKVDLSFNSLKSLSLNWADVYEVPSLRVQTGGRLMKEYSLNANDNHLTSIDLKNDLLPFQLSTKNPIRRGLVNFVKRNLSHVYARYNNSLETFESDYEIPMASCMQLALDFRNNNLQTLRAHSFSDMRSISKLLLRNNGMDAIEPGFVSGKSCFSHGCFIDLSYNRLGMRWSQTMANLTSHVQEFKTPISGLFLRKNMFDSFPYGISAFFAYYRNIWNNASLSDAYATLDLSHNNISSVDRSLCSGLSHVSGTFVLYVNLANNKLKYVSDDAFYCPANVQLLVNLNNNIDLIRLPEKPQLLRSLRLLSIMNTSISSKTLPCVYQFVSDVHLHLDSLAFAPPSWFSSATTLPRDKMMDCCTLYRLKSKKAGLKNINPELMGENEGAEGLLKRLREAAEFMFAHYKLDGKSLKCMFLRNHEQDSGIVMDLDSLDGSSCGICGDEDAILIVWAKWYSALLSWVVLGVLYILFTVGLCAYLFFTKPKIWEMQYAGEHFSYSMCIAKNQLPSRHTMGELQRRGEKRPNILPNSYFTPYRGPANAESDSSPNPAENEYLKVHYGYADVADALPDVNWQVYYSSPLGSEYILVEEGTIRK
eukprot:Nk52_evm8s234 gene=Nk52_evmTU8s234